MDCIEKIDNIDYHIFTALFLCFSRFFSLLFSNVYLILVESGANERV